MSKKNQKDKHRADKKRHEERLRQQRRQRRKDDPALQGAKGVDAAWELREKHKQSVTQTLDSIMNCGSRLDAVLDDYDKIKADAKRQGLCHDFAAAIMLDLHKRDSADGWTWCRGPVDGGIDHSWVECAGWCIDMGDDDELRVWSVDAPQIKIDGPVQRMNIAQALDWIGNWEIKVREMVAAILAALTSRGIQVNSEARTRIESCNDLRTLELWLACAATATSVEAVLETSPELA